VDLVAGDRLVRRAVADDHVHGTPPLDSKPSWSRRHHKL
jgi:hypothetical protein